MEAQGLAAGAEVQEETGVTSVASASAVEMLEMAVRHMAAAAEAEMGEMAEAKALVVVG